MPIRDTCGRFPRPAETRFGCRPTSTAVTRPGPRSCTARWRCSRRCAPCAAPHRSCLPSRTRCCATPPWCWKRLPPRPGWPTASLAWHPHCGRCAAWRWRRDRRRGGSPRRANRSKPWCARSLRAAPTRRRCRWRPVPRARWSRREAWCATGASRTGIDVAWVPCPCSGTGGPVPRLVEDGGGGRSADDGPTRSAHMERRPDRREPAADEDTGAESGAWMIQQDAPHEVAEDPFGLQRPVDRDDRTSPEEYGDMLSELAATRMVAAPDPPREVLLSDDPPESRSVLRFEAPGDAGACFRYPEWDHASASYLEHGATVHVRPCALGDPAWVDATLARHRAHLDGIRRQFEALRPERVRLRGQADGEDIDFDACVQGRADLRAGGVLREGLYESRRPGRRSIAVSLLVDASGSTDGFIGDGRRVIDVEREALLLVCMALQGLGEPFCVVAFSGEGPHGVGMRMLKDFAEPYGQEVALRIAGLEPENYTRAGAAIRHASTLLMCQGAEHRLLLMLSDGKPNDA